MSGGSCGTGGRDGDRAIMVVAECRLVAELMLVRGPKAGDEAGETHAVCLHLWKQLASWRSPPHPPREQKLETGGTIVSYGRTSTTPLVLLLNTFSRVTETRKPKNGC